MHIGELAERTGLSLRTIRHYDDVGLLPAAGRTEGGFRLYSDADLERVMVIRRMKPLGFTLEEMCEVLDIVAALPAGDTEGLRNRLENYRARAQEQRDKLARNLEQADEFIAILGRY